MSSIILSDSKFPAERIYNFSAKFGAKIIELDGTYNSSDDVFNDYDPWETWTAAYQLAQSWYLVQGKDITIFDGISIGKIIEIEMWYFWRNLLERIEIIDRILKLYNPTKIYLATFTNEQIQTIILDFLNIDVVVESIHPSYWHYLSRFRNSEMIRDYLKDMHVDRHVRLFSLFWSKLNHPHQLNSKSNDTIDVLALLEQPGTYLADSILPILDFFPKSSVLLLDSRHYERAVRTNRDIIYQSDSMIKESKSYWKAFRIFNDKWKNHHDEIANALEYNQEKLWPLVAKRIQSVMKRLFPIVSMEIIHTRKLLLEKKVKSLLLSTDAHHGGRLFTLIANQLDIPSLVIQHGATIGEWGYVPLYASRFAAWGEISAEWMIAKGTPPEKVVITGQPRFDRMIKNESTLTRASFSQKLTIISDTFWLLWAMDPITKSENLAILEILLEAISLLPWCSLIIRPHPGIPQVEWLNETLVMKNTERVVVSSPHEPLHDILRIMDVVIIQESTVGLEAMALNKPVVVLLPKEEGYFNGGKDQQITLRVKSVEELQKMLTKLFQFKELGKDYPRMKAQQDFIQRYLFKVDGKSAERAATTITAMKDSFTSSTEANNYVS